MPMGGGLVGVNRGGPPRPGLVWADGQGRYPGRGPRRWPRPRNRSPARARPAGAVLSRLEGGRPRPAHRNGPRVGHADGADERGAAAVVAGAAETARSRRAHRLVRGGRGRPWGPAPRHPPRRPRGGTGPPAPDPPPFGPPPWPRSGPAPPGAAKPDSRAPSH